MKHPCGYASVGITRHSRVETPEELRIEAAKTVAAFGDALIEEFIEGREFTALVAENPDDELAPLVYQPVEFRFPEGESFKHFDLKWRDYKKMSCVPCRRSGTGRPLEGNFPKSSSSAWAAPATAAAISAWIVNGELFMLEINPNCEIFYPPGDEGCADFILLNDPAGHQGFVDTILRSALKRRAVQVRSGTFGKNPERHFGMYAAQSHRCRRA